jgi:hypothetical protein
MFSYVSRASSPVFKFCAPGVVFGDSEGVGSHFHVLRNRTHFWRYRGRRLPFSYFALPDSFSAVPRASGPDFMFCASGLVFGGMEGVGSCFHVLRSQTRFRWYPGRRLPFSCFTLPYSFSVVPTASGPVFMFCSPGLIFGESEGVGSHFHVLRNRTHYWRYRGRRVPFSCFVLPDSFSAVPRASGPVFMFCAPGLVFGDTEGVGSRFHVLRSLTRFRGYRRRQVLFSCFALPDSLSAVQWASAPVFMFCAPELYLGGTDGVRSRFHVCVPRHVFDGAEGVGSHFHVLRPRTHFRRFRGHRVPFSFFTSTYSFSAVPRASGPIFMFCVLVLIFG